MPLNFKSFHFNKFGSTDWRDLTTSSDIDFLPFSYSTIFHDQEPIYVNTFNLTECPLDGGNGSLQYLQFYHYVDSIDGLSLYFNPALRILANSEHSQEKDRLLDTLDFADWYYFFHGFAALDWFRNVRYLPPINKFDKVFITFNNLYIDKRSYRLNLVARLVDKALHTKGHISLNWIGLGDKIKSEITNPNSLLSIESKKLVLKYLAPATDTFTIDTKQQHGALSADDNLKVLSSALWHVVTETIFYDEKLHLTEKIFKPIVAQRPFILVSAPNNLKYLKSYGFQTFSKWIDESYDQELDPDQRIIKIVNETEKLCNLTRQQLEQMHYDMKETLEYNFNWFYTGFKKQIIDELVDNFRRILINQNAGKDKSFESYIDYSQLDFDLIKQKLYQ